MGRMLADTSIQAYESILPELGERQLQVLNAFRKLEYATNAMVAKELNLPINSVTPRSLEIRKKGLIERSHISTCPVTRGRAQFWHIIETFK